MMHSNLHNLLKYLLFSAVTFLVYSQKCTNKIKCLNNGNFNEDTCSCDCLTNYIGNDCSIDLCYKDLDKECRTKRKCVGQISNDRYEDACFNDEDCLKSGRGSYCCFTKTASFCQAPISSSNKSSDCVLYEDSKYAGKKLELTNGQIYKHLNYDKQKHGFRSVKLNKNCKLKLCYDNLNSQKTCINHAFGSDEYKHKKPFPQYMSCFCDQKSISFISSPIHLSVEMNKKIIIPPSNLHHNQFTIRLALRNKIRNAIAVKMGSIHVEISNDKVDLVNTNNLNLFKQINFKRLNDENMLWISFKLLDIQSSFIKIGYGQTSESTNLVTLNGPHLLSNQFDSIDIENGVVKSATIEFKSFENDPSPFLATFYNGHSRNSFSLDLTHLPYHTQLLYNKIKLLKVDLDNDLSKIKYSFAQKGCILNKNNKIIAFKNGNELIKLEIWNSSSINVEHEPNTIQLIKIIHGGFRFDWLNQNDKNNIIKSVEASQDDILWSTPEYFSKFRLTNINNDLGILIRAYYYLNSSRDILNIPDKNFNNFEQIINRCRLEFKRDKCHIKLHYNNKKCSFIGFKCGRNLNYLLSDQINDESLYACNTKSGELVEIENCFKSNKMCVNDEKCETAKRLKAYVRLASAYNDSADFNHIDGRLVLEQFDNCVKLRGFVKGLRPSSHHAIHIHEYSELGNNCRDTGPHFNPYQSLHGSPKDLLIKHAGDLGNLKTNANGYAEIRIIQDSFNIHSDNYLSVLYRSVVIHANRDDLGKMNNDASKSNGNSGLRIACGLILPIN